MTPQELAERCFEIPARVEHMVHLAVVGDSDALEDDQFDWLVHSCAEALSEQFGHPLEEVLTVYQAIVRRGGLHGLGCTLITQRPALLNKSVLTQLDLLILLRLVAGQDQDAVDKNYLKRAGSPENRDLLLASLASLALGEAWVWEPGADPPLYQRVRIRQRRTFNSSATPKPGHTAIEPSRMAAVDLDAVKEAMAAAITRAESDDPSKLRARITLLEREQERMRREWAAEVQSITASLEPECVEVEVPVLNEAALLELERLLGPVTAVLAGVQDHLRWATEETDADTVIFTRQARDGGAPVRRGGEGPRPVADGPIPARPRPDPPLSGTPDSAAQRAGGVPGRPPVRPPGEGAASAKLRGDGAPRRLLMVLATHGPLTPERAGFMANISSRKSTLRNALSTLRSAGLIQSESDRRISITGAGWDEIGEFEPLPMGEALIDYWRSQVGTGKPREIFEALLDAYPSEVSAAELATLLDIDPGVSTLRNALSTLRSLGVVEGNRVSPALMEAAAMTGGSSR